MEDGGWRMMWRLEEHTTQIYTTSDVLSADCYRGNPPNAETKLLLLELLLLCLIITEVERQWMYCSSRRTNLTDFNLETSCSVSSKVSLSYTKWNSSILTFICLLILIFIILSEHVPTWTRNPSSLQTVVQVIQMIFTTQSRCSSWNSANFAFRV